MNVLATLHRNVSLDIQPKLKYKHVCNLINEYHGVPLTMRRLLQDMQETRFKTTKKY